MIACEPTPQLLARLDQRTLTIVPREPLEVLPDVLGQLDAKLRPDGAIAINFRTGETGIGRLLEKVRAAGIGIEDLATEEPDLEDVFVTLTS